MLVKPPNLYQLSHLPSGHWKLFLVVLFRGGIHEASPMTYQKIVGLEPSKNVLSSLVSRFFSDLGGLTNALGVPTKSHVCEKTRVTINGPSLHHISIRLHGFPECAPTEGRKKKSCQGLPIPSLRDQATH